MKTNLFRFALAAAAMLLAGCTVSPMYYPPMEKDDIESEFPAAWEGCWERFDDKEGTITSFILDRKVCEDVQGKPAFLTMMVTQSAEEFLTLPLRVHSVRYGNEPFLAVQADLRRIAESGRISSYGVFMLRPYYYLVKPEMPDKDTLKLSFVSWIEIRDDEFIPLDPAVKLEPDSAVVMNTTAELKALIAAKKYRLVEERIFRRRPAPAPAKP